LTQNMQRNLPHWLGSFLLFTNLQFFLGNTTIDVDWVHFSHSTTLQNFWGKHNSRPNWQSCLQLTALIGFISLNYNVFLELNSRHCLGSFL
jgi:hypothetical protein